ncbi:MAG: hypothetical protein M0R68_08395 [Bacteroidetes bacterium]|nr:hypothetical protein [Bacteroidota bacterium]
MRTLYIAIVLILLAKTLGAQTFQTRNKIDLKVSFSLTAINQMHTYNYTLTNGATAQESVYVFDLLLLSTNVSISNLNASLNWTGIMFADASPQLIRWIAKIDNNTDDYINPLGHGASLSGFSFNSSNSLPGIITYYSEGWAPAPVFSSEDEVTDSIPGYTDLTPYGPGVVGKTVGPALPSKPFVAGVFLDTLLSYTHQSAALGWLKFKQDEDSDDDDEKPEDGIVNNLDKRLQKAKIELTRGDSVKARKELGKFLKKVERIRDRSEKAEQKNKEIDVAMTSEAYALLKYNGEYLLKRLPEKIKGGKHK